MNANRADELPHVDATLNYLGRMDERPRNYTYEPPPGVPRSNAVRDPHVVPIHDARAVADDILLDREGFALVHAASAVKDFWDEDEVRRVYYPEVQRVIAEATGASKVFIFDHTLRRRVKDMTQRQMGGLALRRTRRSRIRRHQPMRCRARASRSGRWCSTRPDHCVSAQTWMAGQAPP